MQHHCFRIFNRKRGDDGNLRLVICGPRQLASSTFFLAITRPLLSGSHAMHTADGSRCRTRRAKSRSRRACVAER
jgi:hypothetical protein